MTGTKDIDRAFAALPRLLPEAAEPPRRALVAEAAIRLDEAAETVRRVIADAAARHAGDPAAAADAAMRDYRQLARFWPPERKRVLDGYFQDLLARTRRQAEAALEDAAVRARPRRLLTRLAAAAAEALATARRGDAAAVDAALRRVLLLRDLACRLGALDAVGAASLTAGFAADLAEAQVRGEIRRLAAADPLAALAHALAFAPELPEAEAAFLRRAALAEAEDALHAAERGRLTEEGSAGMWRRAAQGGEALRLLAAYAAGGAVPAGENLPELAETLAEAAARRGMAWDDADALRDLWDGVHRADPLAAAAAVAAEAAAGRIGWTAACRLLAAAGEEILQPLAVRTAAWTESLGAAAETDFALPPCLAHAEAVGAAMLQAWKNNDREPLEDRQVKKTEQGR
ncbi:hypothetical protein [Oleispirillum naphthae]|uniref:hypothetical protein n=1 Tax=Oleispirillum naphthae TaxID=2838853 RepID=UPI003082659C